VLRIRNKIADVVTNFKQMKKIIFSLGLVLTFSVVFSQSHTDALRYSQHIIGGTARYTAMGGAFGALGGDFSTLSHNPAGLAVYRSSEITFTPEFHLDNTNSRYFGKEVSESKFSLNLNNLGYVTAYKNSGILKYVNFGVGYNKIANFSKSYLINGNNPYSTYSDYMAEQANVHGLDAFGSGLFYEGFAIDDKDADHYYVNKEYFINDTVFEQKFATKEYGKINEWTFSLGMNFSDIFYFGATLGWQPLRYESERTIREFDIRAGREQLIKYSERLEVSGNGITGKFGAIVRPIPMLRFGAAYHLPVVYSLNEEFTPLLESVWIKSGIISPRTAGATSDILAMDYVVTSPAKAIGSAAIILDKFLILSGDIEYIDYSKMRMRSDEADFDDQNELIREIYTNTMNLKVGAEFRMGSLYFRGGLAYFGSPYAKAEENTDAIRLNYSGGFGIRDEKFFFDVAYQLTSYDERQYQYSVTVWNNLYEPAANLDTKTHRLQTTFGFRF
jgi:hypothetical protein